MRKAVFAVAFLACVLITGALAKPALAWDIHQTLMPMILSGASPGLRKVFDESFRTPCAEEDRKMLQSLIPALLLNQNSHVLLLPLDETQRYGEYTYTGGLLGTEILLIEWKTNEAKILFALPSGYRTCVTTLMPTIACVV